MTRFDEIASWTDRPRRGRGRGGRVGHPAISVPMASVGVRRAIRSRRRRSWIDPPAWSDRTSDRNPPGSSSIWVGGRTMSATRRASTASARAAASSGVERATQDPGQEARPRSAVRRELVQPGVLSALDHERLGRVSRGLGDRAGAARDARPARPRRRCRGRGGPGPSIRRSAVRRGDVGDDVAARPEVDPGREPGQRIGDHVGEGESGEPERLAGQAPRVGRRRRSRRRRRSGARRRRARIAPIAPIEWPRIAALVTSGRASSARQAASASAPNSPAVIGSVSATFAPWPRTSTARQWKPAACRNWTIGRSRSRADSQPWTTATPGPGRAAGGRHEPARQGQPVARCGTATSSNARPRSAGVRCGGRGVGKPARVR